MRLNAKRNIVLAFAGATRASRGLTAQQEMHRKTITIKPQSLGKQLFNAVMTYYCVE